MSNLKDGLKAARALCGLELRLEAGDPPNQRYRGTVAALRASTVIICVSAFERFMEELVQHHAGRIAKRVPEKRFDRLPVALQKHSMRETLRVGWRAGGEWETEGLRRAVQAGQTVSAGMVNPAVFGRSQHSGAKAVREILTALGLGGVLEQEESQRIFERQWESAVHRTYLTDKLNEITVNRHDQAHRFDLGSALTIARGDADEAIRFLGVVGGLLADRVRSRTTELIATALKAR